ncbi:alpha/beta hydrolase [Actinomadura vinacea]|uniref:Alpha/beta hydrolase n=1 Tax=Actinomadura vinacea TaxID=115336 RepID=A0ABP5WPV9_9ACTN
MRRPTMLLAVLCAAASITAMPAQAAAPPPDPVPDDQPLPGYTIGNPPLAPVPVDGRPSRVLQGVKGHAAFNIEVPPNWNGQLVMWAHGYRGTTRVLSAETPSYGLRQKLLDQGYAWAASSYYANDYDVRAGVLSTRQLARHFARTIGKPRKTFIAGVSMGGHVTARSIEEFPGFYDGALPMCGVLGDHELFDFFLDYQVVAQDLADLPAYPTPPDYVTSIVPRIQQGLGLTGLTPGGPDTTNDLGKQFRAIAVNRSGGARPGDAAAFAYWQNYLFSLGAPPSGDSLAQQPRRIATNLRTRYAPSTPVNVNRTVQRVRPVEPGSRYTDRLTQVPSVSGRLDVPMVSLHNLGDMFVPFSMEQRYRADVARNGRSGLLVQRAIRSVGHCEFSPAEAGKAWDDLIRWERGGPRPQGDDVSRPGKPDYGCRFTDPAVHGTGTRPLYPACP